MNSILKVLIVDDSIVIQERLIAMLGDLEKVAIVGQAGSGREAVEMNRALCPDVMILDIQIPDGNGFEVLRAIREESPRQAAIEPVVIVLSNYSQVQYRGQALRSGAQYFFDKSLEFKKVREVLQHIVTIDTPSVDVSPERWLG